MTTSHTSGPWTHEGQGDITGIENDPASGCVGKVDVACVYLRTVPGKTEANARLIAAAPDLLTALTGLLALDADHQRGADDDDVCIEVRQARAAIAKAEGGAT